MTPGDGAGDPERRRRPLQLLPAAWSYPGSDASPSPSQRSGGSTHRGRPTNVIHHSDQGVRYTSIAFGQRCREINVRPSTGSAGDAYDNAMCGELLRHSRMRTARSPPLQAPGRSAAGCLRLRRGLVQPASAALGPRLRVTHQLRTAAARRVQVRKRPSVHGTGVTPLSPLPARARRARRCAAAR